MAVTYASTDDVLARAGRFAPAFQVVGRRPDLSDLDKYLVDVANELNVAIRSRGFDPATINPEARDALRDLAAYGALARALASLPADRATSSALESATTLWESGLKQIESGESMVLVALEAGVEGAGGATAGSFWDDEPDYGTPESVRAEAEELRGTTLAPAWEREQAL